jgi:hypothetical protein
MLGGTGKLMTRRSDELKAGATGDHVEAIGT